MKNSFFHLSDIPGCGNIFSVKRKSFLTNSSLRPVERDFLSSRTFFIQSSVEALKFGRGNPCVWKLILLLVELIFSYFSDTLSSKSYFPSSGNVFLKAHFKV